MTGWILVLTWKFLETLQELESEGRRGGCLCDQFLSMKRKASLVRRVGVTSPSCLSSRFWLGSGWKFLKRPVYHDALADLSDRFVASEPVPTAWAYPFMSIISLSLPLQQVKTMYYLPVDFYRYLIGREDQSVNEQVMIKRIDQQLKVNRLLVDQLDLSQVSHPKCENICWIILKSRRWFPVPYSTEQAQQSILPKTGAMDLYSAGKSRGLSGYSKTMLSRLTKHSVLPARKLSNVVYQITKSVYGFN